MSISPGLPCGDTDPHARGSGCARETLCAAGRGEGARAREILCACRGHRSRIAGVLHELWAILVVRSTCGGRVLQRGPRTSGTPPNALSTKVESVKSVQPKLISLSPCQLPPLPILIFNF